SERRCQYRRQVTSAWLGGERRVSRDDGPHTTRRRSGPSRGEVRAPLPTDELGQGRKQRLLELGGRVIRPAGASGGEDAGSQLFLAPAYVTGRGRDRKLIILPVRIGHFAAVASPLNPTFYVSITLQLFVPRRRAGEGDGATAYATGGRVARRGDWPRADRRGSRRSGGG